MIPTGTTSGVFLYSLCDRACHRSLIGSSEVDNFRVNNSRIAKYYGASCLL